jgi:WD40 repeat protein
MLSLEASVARNFWRQTPNKKNLSSVCLIKVPALPNTVISSVHATESPVIACINSAKRGQPGKLTLFELGTFKQMDFLPIGSLSGVSDIKFRPTDYIACNQEISVATENGLFRYDLELEERLDPRGSHANKIAYSPNGKLLAVGNKSGVVSVWELKGSQTIEIVQRSTGKHAICSLAFSWTNDSLFILTGDGRVLELNLVAEDKTYAVFDLVDSREYGEGFCASIHAHPSAPLLSYAGEGDNVGIWQYHERESALPTVDTIPSHQERRDWKLSTNGRQEHDSRQWLYNDDTLTFIATGISRYIYSTKFLPNGLLATIGVADDTTKVIEIIDLVSHTCLAHWTSPDPNDVILGAHQYGRTLFVFVSKK